MINNHFHIAYIRNVFVLTAFKAKLVLSVSRHCILGKIPVIYTEKYIKIKKKQYI